MALEGGVDAGLQDRTGEENVIKYKTPELRVSAGAVDVDVLSLMREMNERVVGRIRDELSGDSR